MKISELSHPLVHHPSFGLHMPNLIKYEATKSSGQGNTYEFESLKSIEPVFVESFKKVFGPANHWELKHDKPGWVIVEHKDHQGCLLELELPALASATEHTQQDETETTTVELHGARYSRSHSIPEIGGNAADTTADDDLVEDERSERVIGVLEGPHCVLSLLVEGERIPIFYLDFTNCPAILKFWQLATHLAEGFKHMKSATGHPAIAGALIHFWGSASILACDLSLQNFNFKVNSWGFEVSDGKRWGG